MIKKKWLGFFFVALILEAVLLVYFVYSPPTQVSWFYPIINGFNGNLTASILSGVLFLFIALHVDAMTKVQIDRIEKVTTRSEEVLAERERALNNERAVSQFEEFMKKKSYYDVRFPDLKPEGSDSLGLQYRIIPKRDSKTGGPFKKETETETSFVVKVIGPAYYKHMEPEDRKRYEASPICDNEYYFCQFYNDSWHMGRESVGRDWFKFYLSGIVGPVQWGQSANEFMSSFEDPIGDREKVATLHLKEDGTELVEVGKVESCTSYEIYRDKDCNLFLRVWKSLLKPMYYTNPPETYDDTGWFFVIEDMRGNAHGQKLKNVKRAVLTKLQELKLEPKKIPGFEIEDKQAYPDGMS